MFRSVSGPVDNPDVDLLHLFDTEDDRLLSFEGQPADLPRIQVDVGERSSLVPVAWRSVPSTSAEECSGSGNSDGGESTIKKSNTRPASRASRQLQASLSDDSNGWSHSPRKLSVVALLFYAILALQPLLGSYPLSAEALLDLHTLSPSAASSLRLQLLHQCVRGDSIHNSSHALPGRDQPTGLVRQISRLARRCGTGVDQDRVGGHDYSGRRGRSSRRSLDRRGCHRAGRGWSGREGDGEECGGHGDLTIKCWESTESSRVPSKSSELLDISPLNCH